MNNCYVDGKKINHFQLLLRNETYKKEKKQEIYNPPLLELLNEY